MKKLDEVKAILARHKAELREKYKVKAMSIFGSVVRNEASEESDIDILVEFEAPIGFFKFLELEEHLEKLLGMKVDLVSKKALKPRIGKRIIEEAIPV